MRIKAFCISIFFLFALSCTDESVPSPPVDVQFQLLNKNGETTTTFHAGEDIRFDYTIINRTDESVTWYFDSLFNYRNLFTVFEKVPPSAEMPNGGNLRIGTPQTPQIQRDSRLGRIIPANGEMRILMSWKGDFENTFMFDNWQIYYHEREPLPVGNYFVEFEQEINFARYDNLRKKFRIDFEVR